MDSANSRLRLGSRDKDVGWYNPTLSTLNDSQRDLFENYSHIPAEAVIPHILEVRDKAWEFHPLPCIGQYRFIDFALARSPSYPRILSSLKEGSTLLDLGCCFAQDLRKLVFDGAPASSLYGADLEGEFIELAYELFLDRDSLGVKFIVADIFDDESPLRELDGKLDIINIGLFLHLFDWEEQSRACKRMVGLLKNTTGCLIIGQQIGSLEPKDVPYGTSKKVFRHDIKSFEKLWKEVGEETGTEWRVKASMDGALGIAEKKRTWDDDLTRRLIFEIERIK